MADFRYPSSMTELATHSQQPSEAWEAVLESLCRLQTILPDLRDRFDTILEQLESVAGWETAHLRRPVLILGSPDGVETGVRQLRRSQPLETAIVNVAGRQATLPTLPEVLRIKAFLCLDRNATRDYLNTAALAAHMGVEQACQALWRMDELYPQRNGDTWAVRTQLIMQFAAPHADDLDSVDLSEYKGVQPPFDQWSHVADICGQLSDCLLNAVLQALADDASPDAAGAQAKIATWQQCRASDDAPSPGKLPGLKP